MEQRYLHFFNTFTAPSLSADFSPEFWKRRVLQASAAEPSIRHAVIALGAIHEDYCMRQQNQSNNQEYDSSTQAFAFRQYTKAISDLQQLMPIQNQPLDTTLIACILFISFDSLIGNQWVPFCKACLPCSINAYRAWTLLTVPWQVLH